MNDVAETGIAAHWLYKTQNIAKGSVKGNKDRTDTQRRAKEWLRNILEMNKTAGNPEEFFENVKMDLFPDEVYIFTPKGKIMALPSGSTTIDFAYAIHTRIGDKCVGAKINEKLQPLKTILKNGDQIEIITSEESQPSPLWERFAVTSRVKSQIRRFFRSKKRAEYIIFGKEILNAFFKKIRIISSIRSSILIVSASTKCLDCLGSFFITRSKASIKACLLYTSDAADE